MNDLEAAITSMWAAFGGVPSSATVQVWAKELGQYDGPNLRSAIREAASGEHRPNLGTVKNRYFALKQSAENKTQRIPDLTPAERERADAACVMSLLWLHYECNWSLDEIAGHVIARQLGRNARDALEEAKRQIGRDRVFGWMSAKAKKDPLSGDAVHVRAGRLSP